MALASSFASDNNAGIHPAVLAAIAAANEGHARAYGDDRWTARALARFTEAFGENLAVFPVFGGTGANVVGLRALADSYHAILCADTAHIQVDECGAPERFIGCKLLALPTADGKLRPADLQPLLKGFGVEHHAQPRVVSITQATEYGTVYTPAETRALADFAHGHGLLLHMDGARLANAAAGLGVSLRALTRDVGVDVLSFGGTKNGLMGAEAVVFFHPAHAATVPFLRKQAMQLPSKMRFLAAQFEALFTDELWRRNAEHANRMARLLAELVATIPQVQVTQPVESNAVFATLPPQTIAPLQDRAFFYVWDESRHEVRWMTSFDTTESDVRVFADAVAAVVGGGPA